MQAVDDTSEAVDVDGGLRATADEEKKYRPLREVPIHTPTDHPENGLRSHDASRVILCWARGEPPDDRASGRCCQTSCPRRVGSRAALQR